MTVDTASRRTDVEPAGLLQPLVYQVAGEHPDAVAAHLGQRPVRIAVVHEPVGQVGAGQAARLGVSSGAHYPQHAVAADARAPIAQAADPVAVQDELAVGVGQQYEVVLGAMPLDERDHGHQRTCSRRPHRDTLR